MKMNRKPSGEIHPESIGKRTMSERAEVKIEEKRKNQIQRRGFIGVKKEKTV